MLIVRPAKNSDLESFIALKDAAGPGFTSLAVHNSDLKARLKKSSQSFGLETDEIGNNIYLLVNEYSGASEVGTLFIKSKMRGTGAGRLISQARYMLIASSPTRFADTIISELRGQVDAKGYSPFWEGMGRKFFKMDFNEADEITAKTDNQFITDLLPRYPIYIDLLPEDTREVIGQCHPDGVGAKRLLEAEGFRYEKFVDIFDAGPTLEVRRDQIRTVKESRLYTVQSGEEGNSRALICNNRIKNFRAVHARVNIDGNTVDLSSEVRKALRIKVGEQVRLLVS